MDIVRNVMRRKFRSVLTISGIVIGILALTTMGAISEHFNALLDGGVAYYSGGVQVQSGGSNTGSLVTTDLTLQIARVTGVVKAFPNIEMAAKPGAVRDFNLSIPDFIATLEPAELPYLGLQLQTVSGRFLSSGSTGEVVLGSDFAAEFHKTTGDVISLPIRTSDSPPDLIARTYRVVGTLRPTRTVPDNGAYVSLPDAQRMLGDSLPTAVQRGLDISALATQITVYGQKNVGLLALDALAARITANVPGVKAIPPSRLVTTIKQGSQTFTALATGAALLALVIGGISIVNTMIMSVTERVREIGLKKALGASARDVLLESTLIGAVGGLVGLGFGAVVTIAVNATAATPSTQLFLLTPSLAGLALAFAITMGAIAGVIPAFRAARLDPVSALRGY